jgi:hypothetical protein
MPDARPLYHDDRAPKELHERTLAAITRMQWLKVASGALALALIGAIWLVWLWG